MVSLNRFLIVFSCLLLGCTLHSEKKRYILAEKLWSEGHYQTAVAEFDAVARMASDRPIGMQALLRSGKTRSIFLGDHDGAIDLLTRLVERSRDPELVQVANEEIGDIYFERKKDYEAALKHYRGLLSQPSRRGKEPEYLYRIAKALFFKWRFLESVKTFESIIQLYAKSPYARLAQYEIGVVWLSQGEQSEVSESERILALKKGISAFEKYIEGQATNELNHVAEAQFGIATAYEGLDQLDRALALYETLKADYPTPTVIEIKLRKLKERIVRRDRS